MSKAMKQKDQQIADLKAQLAWEDSSDDDVQLEIPNKKNDIPNKLKKVFEINLVFIINNFKFHIQ